MAKVKIGIIGIGQIGKMHLDRYKTIADAEIVAVADINKKENKRVCDVYEIPTGYSDYRELLKRKDIVAVDVCLHNNLHMPMTVAAMTAGKEVYCEKPMAGSYRDALIMLKTAKKKKRKLSIQINTLFTKETKIAKTLIDKGHLGKIYHARSTGFRRRGRPYVDGYGTSNFVQKKIAAGGALYDMGVYHIANMLYLLGNPEVVRISGKTYQETDMDPVRKRVGKYDVEELGLGFVRFKNNITLDIIEAWAIHLNGFEGSSVVGNKAGIRLQPFGFYRNIGDFEMDSTVNMEPLVNRWKSMRENSDAYISPQHHWIAVLQGRVPLLPTAEVALNTMLISEGIYLSDKLGREVTAAEVVKHSKSTAIKL